ncbi:Sulfotransferase domain [Mactra antiquata]
MAEEKPRMNLDRKLYKGIVVHDNDEFPRLEKMEIRDDDIWVCSFPRSGTTLTQELVYLVETLDFKKVYEVQLDERFPIVGVKDERFPYYQGIDHIEKLPSPRMLKCHLHHFMLPEQLRNGKGRIIYICRNPKDIASSFFRLMQWADLLLEEEKSFDYFIEEFVNGTGLGCPWPRHLLEYWEKRNENVLFLKYEEVIKDLPKTVRSISDFLKKDLSDEDIKKISDYCQFNNMKSNDKCNMSYYRTFKHVNDEAEGGFMNKGKAGVWRDLLKPEVAARIDGMIRQLDGTGLEIPDV